MKNFFSKKFIIIFLILCFYVSGNMHCIAVENQPISVLVDGNKLEFDVNPVVEGGRTLVPLRVIFEALGAKVEWDSISKTITGIKDDKVVKIQIDNLQASVNGENKALDVPPKIIDGRTLVPLRFISESLGGNVSWDGTTSTAKISSAESNSGTTGTNNSSNTDTTNKMLFVNFIDVGQADSILIQTPSGKNVIIDAGNNSNGDNVVNYIKGKGIEKIDYVICTHPHEDHIGGMDKVIDSFEIGRIYMPKAQSNTKTFESLLLSIQKKGLKVKQAISGVVLDLGDVKASIIAPISASYDDLNNYSAVIKLTYGENSFLLMGDAESVSENELLAQSKYSLKADVLKVGHHGSSSSTSSEFLDAVSPRYAVISVGKDNDYGHPHDETISKISGKNIQLLRTDKLGTVEIKSDGSKIYYDKNSSPIKENAPSISNTSDTPIADMTKPSVSNIVNMTYIGNKNTKKFHLDTCKSLPIPANRVELASREDAINSGYDPCKNCNP